jgi:hypothetical protein
MDKKLEASLKTGMNTKLTTCDDKRVFTDDDDVHILYQWTVPLSTHGVLLTTQV